MLYRAHIPLPSLPLINYTAIPPPQSVSGIAYETENGGRRILPVGPDIEVTPPAEPRLRFLIDQVALLVVEEGAEAEEMILEAQRSSVEYSWMRCDEGSTCLLVFPSR